MSQNIMKILLKTLAISGEWKWCKCKFSLGSKSSAIESALQCFDWPRGDNISSILGGGGEVNWFFYATVLGRFFDYNVSEKARTGWKLARFIIENGNCVKNVRLPSQNLREADTRWKWPVNPKRGLSAVVACIASIPVLTERNRAAPRSFSCEKWSESNSGRAKCEAIAKTRK